MGIQGGWIFKTSETNFEMKFLCFFTALFAVAQAQFSINLPKAGATIQPGQNLTVQVFVPIDSVCHFSVLYPNAHNESILICNL